MGTGRRASGRKTLPRTGSGRQRRPLEEVVAAYRVALDRQPLAASTKRAYLGKVEQFAAWLAGVDGDFGDLLADPTARYYAARGLQSPLKRCRRCPRTINQGPRGPRQLLPVQSAQRRRPPGRGQKAWAPGPVPGGACAGSNY